MEVHLRNVRNAKGFSIRELGDISGVSKSQISDFENGVHDITVGKLCKVCNALGCTLNDVVSC
jgi:transcriptional regulator with XRE-family HTH domain